MTKDSSPDEGISPEDESVLKDGFFDEDSLTGNPASDSGKKDLQEHFFDTKETSGFSHDSSKKSSQPSLAKTRSQFDAALSAHDWLRSEVSRFMFQDLPEHEAFAGTLSHLEQATKDLEILSGSQFESGDLMGFELRLGSSQDLRRAFFDSLPTPAALMLLCCDRAEPGDHVVVVHHLAHQESVEMRSVWPFPMDVAVSMVSPSASMLVARPTSSSKPQRRRWFKKM
jgi:hypothetical protein